MYSSTIRFVLMPIFACLLFFSTAWVSGGEYDKPSTTALQEYISKNCRQECVDADLLLFGVEKVSKEQGVDPVTLLAIAKVESGFRAKAVNAKNGRSVGLMQIQVKWHREKFRTGKHSDIMDNLTVGAMVYRACLDKHRGRREKALHCYNGYQRDGIKKYVSKVMKVHAEISSMRLYIA